MSNQIMKRAEAIVRAGLITDNGDGSYSVKSQYGSSDDPYTVRGWDCNCPYRSGHQTCKHVLAVKMFRDGAKPEAMPEPEVPSALLQSAVQKCIRRGWIEQAVRCASYLWDGDYMTLVRRLPIIMVEDVMPHPDVLLLAELLRTKVKPDDEEKKETVLQIVADLAASRYRDYLEDSEETEWLEDRLAPVGSVPWQVCMGLHIRGGFGGSQGDLWQLNRAARLWLDRFADDTHRWLGWLDKAFPGTDISQIDRVFSPADIPLCAVDHHCFGGFPNAIARNKPEVIEWLRRPEVQLILLEDEVLSDRDYLRYVIWYGRSSRTDKIDITSGQVKEYRSWLGPTINALMDEFFETFKADFDGLSRWWIQRSFE